MSLSEQSLNIIARTCHEANKTICDHFEENSDQVHWNELSDEDKKAGFDGVKEIINNPDLTPKESHDRWRKSKEESGWTYGEEKDPDAKTHPLMIPYEELTDEHQLKDEMFIAIVKSFLQ